MAKMRNVAVLELIPAVARTASVNGSGVDLTGYLETYGHEMAAYLNVGAAAAGTLNVKIQESDDNSAFTDISGATFTQVTTSVATQTIYFQTRKRYIRAVGTAGSTPNHTYSVVALATPRAV